MRGSRNRVLTTIPNSESTSIPVNPRTNRPVGYAFVDLATAQEAQNAIAELSGKEILERKVSVQVARKPEPAEAKADGAVSGAEGASGAEGRKRGSGRGRGRGRGRGGRFRGGGRAGAVSRSPLPARLRGVRNGVAAPLSPCSRLPGRETEALTGLLTVAQAQRQAQNGAAAAQTAALTEVTNETNTAAATETPKETKPRGRPQKQRGPPEDGIPSKTKVMVANLPYDLSEEKVCRADQLCSQLTGAC